MDFLSEAIKAEVKESEKAMNELLKATQTYQEKRRLMEEQYQASRKKLIEAGKFSELAVLAQQHRDELDQLDDANVRKLDTFRKLFDGVEDRKSVVKGKSVSVSVDLGGRRIIKKKKNKNNK